jgi:hypothetical protein
LGLIIFLNLQATFCGSSLGKKKGYHFTTRDFEEMGYDFCDTLLDYCDPDTTKVNLASHKVFRSLFIYI